jgi:1,4-alpha-glucan branching enzyme
MKPATAAPNESGPRERLLAARLHEPRAFLGLHRDGAAFVYRAFRPATSRMWLRTDDGPVTLARDGASDLFVARLAAPPTAPYRLVAESDGGRTEFVDPYGFAPTIGDFDLHLFNEGRLLEAWRMLGAVPMSLAGVAGVRFAVWAPNAERVSLVGDFNGWDGRTHPLDARGASGVWELFVPGLEAGALYKFELRHRDTGLVFVKSDPYGRAFELRPSTAARVMADSAYRWGDGEWLARRAAWDFQRAPINVYEVHAGSWMRHPDGRFYGWRELADRLVPYASDLGFTHIELMPITEHPLDESWGYQTTGYFAPTSRHGTPDDFRAFVDRCHQAGLGVILDWVPGHFPGDAFALAHFDGTALYEHDDPRVGRHPDWGTHVFNYGRPEVRSFLLSSACYWLSEFHLDGLRVDAVASMLYLDYSRAAGEWIPNRYGGRENLEAIDFVRDMNTFVHGRFPGAVTIAEESTAWPLVSRPVDAGGLGFTMKWNMGWMHDTLEYMRRDPVHRRYHHRLLSFGQLYAYTENFVLPLSHDEVVHGKRSLLGKMPGDPWQQFANARLLAAWQMTYPGKKLAFMGNEFAQGPEWSERGELAWPQLGLEAHAGVQRLYRDLGRLYRDVPALHDQDFEQGGFEWLDVDDSARSVLSFVRRARDGSFVIVALNFTPVPRDNYHVGVPRACAYRELVNTDSRHYGGGDLGNRGEIVARPGHPSRPATLALVLPPLAALVLVPA